MTKLFNKKQMIFGIIGIVIAIIFFATESPEGLDPKGWHALGIFLMAVMFWVGNTLPDYVTCLFLQMMLVLTKCVGVGDAFSAWSGGVIWIVIPIFVVGAALGKTGFLRRIVLKILTWFPGSWSKQILGLFVAGNIISPMIPSATAKVAIAAPLCRTYNHELGFEENTKSAAGFFSTAWMAFSANGTFWLTGTTMTFTMTGLLAAEYQGWTFVDWIKAAWPLGVVLFLLSYFSILLFYKPADAKPVSKEFQLKQYEALGPMSFGEKVSAVVLVVCIIMWILEKQIGVSAAVTAMIGMLIFMATKIIDKNDFRSKIAWESIVFIAASTSLGTVFSKTGITSWVGATFSDLLSPLFSSPIVMIISFVVIISIMRFFFVSQTGLMTIFVVACAPFAEAAGINPWCFGFVILTIVNVFPTKYSNGTMITAMAASGDMCEFKQISKMSYVYALATIIGCICCLPVWHALGMIA